MLQRWQDPGTTPAMANGTCEFRILGDTLLGGGYVLFPRDRRILMQPTSFGAQAGSYCFGPTPEMRDSWLRVCFYEVVMPSVIRRRGRGRCASRSGRGRNTWKRLINEMLR